MSSRRSALLLLLAVSACWRSRLPCPHLAWRMPPKQGRIDAPRAVEMVLARQGFRDVVDLRRKGAIWVARASGPDGRRMLAVVDAASGEITGLKPVDGPPIPPRASVVRF